MADDPLIRPLQIPLPPTVTECVGVFQGDIIIRTALVAAIADMRANPWLLDFCFASLPRDTLTLGTYGEREVSRAKEWFTKTNIAVTLGVLPYETTPPAALMSVHLLGSNEEANTLGDINPTTVEEWEAAWEPLTQKFSPVSYSALTGTMTLPANIAQDLVVSTNMAIVDKTGKKHLIMEVAAADTVVITKGTVADFTDCFIKPAIPAYVASLEGARFRETYVIGCHAAGEPVHLTYLHSIAVFALLRYRQALLEARGLQVSSISSSEFKAQDLFEDLAQPYYSRYVNLVGSVQHVWPKNVDYRVLAVDVSADPSLPQNDEELAYLDTLDSLGMG